MFSARVLGSHWWKFTFLEADWRRERAPILRQTQARNFAIAACLPDGIGKFSICVYSGFVSCEKREEGEGETKGEGEKEGKRTPSSERRRERWVFRGKPREKDYIISSSEKCIAQTQSLYSLNASTTRPSALPKQLKKAENKKL